MVEDATIKCECLIDKSTDVCTDLNPRNDPVRVPLDPVTHARAKLFKEFLQTLVRILKFYQHGVHRDIEYLKRDNQVIYTLIQAHEGSSGPPHESAE
mgnify:CR=1 FL=1